MASREEAIKTFLEGELQRRWHAAHQKIDNATISYHEMRWARLKEEAEAITAESEFFGTRFAEELERQHTNIILRCINFFNEYVDSVYDREWQRRLRTWDDHKPNDKAVIRDNVELFKLTKSIYSWATLELHGVQEITEDRLSNSDLRNRQKMKLFRHLNDAFSIKKFVSIYFRGSPPGSPPWVIMEMVEKSLDDIVLR
ncbi:MAG: hypothetical protein L6R37_007577 [Teloschistes peruensis]|nr:MAG: hypothetical protein L6R37_007577 [Teloschistes peruensis]